MFSAWRDVVHGPEVMSNTAQAYRSARRFTKGAPIIIGANKIKRTPTYTSAFVYVNIYIYTSLIDEDNIGYALLLRT